MNAYIKSTCFLFFFIQFAYSQEYVPFPTDSTVWKQSWATGDSGYQTGSGAYLQYLLGDSLINGKTYSLLYHGWYPYSPDSIPPSIAQMELEGGIREENKRVYYTDLWNGEFLDEVLLYDFNLEVGDTLHCGMYVHFPTMVVENIDSVQILNGSYRKRYTLIGHGSWGTPYVIEGIGSVDGPLFPCGSDNWHHRNWLRCMGTVDEYTYDNYLTELPSSDTRCFDTVINVEFPTYEPLILHPNPTTGIVRLSEPMYDVHLSVYSSIGQKVRDNRAFSGSTIDLNGLASGVYFVVMLGDENYLGKVVKE